MTNLLQRNDLGYKEITYNSFLLNYEEKIWIKNDMAIKKMSPSHQKSFVFSVFGQVYFLIPDGETYFYDIKVQEWKSSDPIIDNRILQDSVKLSIIRLV